MINGKNEEVIKLEEKILKSHHIFDAGSLLAPWRSESILGQEDK